MRRPGTEPTRLIWPHPTSSTYQMTEAAGDLVDLFGPAHARGEVQTLLARDDLDIDSLSKALDAVLDLPELAVPEPECRIVVTRGDPVMVRLAAAIAGPTWILAADADCTITIPALHEAVPEALAAAVSATTNRRDRTLLLWRHADAFGLQIWRRGSLDVTWSWGSGWETVVRDSLALETAVCD